MGDGSSVVGRTRWVRGVSVVVVAAAALLVAGAGIALACTGRAALVEIKPSSVEAGDSVTVSGTRFHEDSVRLTLDSGQGAVLGTAQGPSFNAQVTVPADTAGGPHYVVATAYGDDGEVVGRDSIGFSVASEAPQEREAPQESGDEPGETPEESGDAGQSDGGPSSSSMSTSGSESEGSMTADGSEGSMTADGSDGSASEGSPAPGAGQPREPAPAPAPGESGPSSSDESAAADNDSPAVADEDRQQVGSPDGEQAASPDRQHVGAAPGEPQPGEPRPSVGDQPAPQAPTTPDAATPQASTSEPAAGEAPQAREGEPAASADNPTEAADVPDEAAEAESQGEPEAAEPEAAEPEAAEPEAEAGPSDTSAPSGHPSARSGSADLWSGFGAGDGVATPGLDQPVGTETDGAGEQLLLAAGLLGAGLLTLTAGSFAAVRRRRALATATRDPRRDR